MNYIKQLQATVEELKAEKAEANEAATELLIYLQSSKFHNDPTVQVQDVINRLMPIRMATMGS